MNGLVTSFFVILFVAVSHGLYNGRGRNMYSLQNNCRDLSLSCSYDDLSTLVAVVRALEEKECGYSGNAPSGSLCNAEDLIMNLVNALINLTTHAISHNCPCSNQGGSNNNGGNGNNNNGGNGNNNNGGYSYPSGGLLNVDLLNPNKKDNVLELDVAKQNLLGVGLGDGGGSSQGSSGRNANAGNNDSGSATSQANATSNSNGSNTSGSNNEGLVNVDLLNPNKQNNVADVDIAKQNILGVGLGNRSDNK